MWGNDIVSAIKEKTTNKSSITNHVILYERLDPCKDAYLQVVQRYNKEVENCLFMGLPEDSDNTKADQIIEGWISQLVWALCISRYNQGVSNEYGLNLWNFIMWLNKTNKCYPTNGG